MTDINITERRMIIHLLEREDLESLKTKQLIDMLWYERIHYGGDWDTCELIYDNGLNMVQYRLMEYGHYSREDVQKYKDYVEVKLYRDTSVLEFTYADRNLIKEILKSRPHIPNKEERKEQTQEEIKKSKGKVKRNLKYKR